MCGIVGFNGNHQADPILLDGLSKFEYRGYDSAGLAVRDGESEVEIVRANTWLILQCTSRSVMSISSGAWADRALCICGEGA